MIIDEDLEKTKKYMKGLVLNAAHMQHLSTEQKQELEWFLDTIDRGER